MNMKVDITDLMDELDLEELGVELDPAPVTAGQVLDELTRRGVLTSHGKRRRGPRMAVRVAIAAALALALSVTAYAVADYAGFFEKVFGGPDAGKQTYEIPVDHWDEEGNQASMEIITEGEPVDQALAQELLGDRVTDAPQSITVGDYTCTVENVTVGENGVGAMTYSIENPKGLPEIQVFNEVMGFYQWADAPVDAGDGEGCLINEPHILLSGAATEPLTWEKVSAASSPIDAYSAMTSVTDTRLEGRIYFVAAAPEGWPKALDLYFFERKSEGDTSQVEDQFAEDYRLTVPMPAPAEALTLTAEDGWTASISPLGLAVTATEGTDLDGGNEITVHYADGSEYVVEGEEPYVHNTIFGYLYKDTVYEVFNRLVDPTAVTDVTVTTLSGETLVFTPAA